MEAQPKDELQQQVDDLSKIVEDTKNLDQLDPETQLEHSKKIVSQQFNMLKFLAAGHIRNFGSIMISTNGVSYQDKLVALKALEKAVMESIEFGVNPERKPDLPAPGVRFSKEINNMVQCLVKLNELKTLLLAYNYKQNGEENETSEPSVPTTESSTTEQQSNTEG